jgi:hypothetical protein
MMRLIALGFILSAISAAQAMPVGPVKLDSQVTPVREACGAGMHRINGVCVRTPARRNAARCAAGRRC